MLVHGSAKLYLDQQFTYNTFQNWIFKRCVMQALQRMTLFLVTAFKFLAVKKLKDLGQHLPSSYRSLCLVA